VNAKAFRELLAYPSYQYVLLVIIVVSVAATEGEFKAQGLCLEQKG
jgi:hypothetical protein